MEPILEEELRTIIRAATRPDGTYGSQTALALAMNKSINYISLIVRGKTSISNEVAGFFGRELVKTYPLKKGGL